MITICVVKYGKQENTGCICMYICLCIYIYTYTHIHIYGICMKGEINC